MVDTQQLQDMGEQQLRELASILIAGNQDAGELTQLLLAHVLKLLCIDHGIKYP